MCCCQVILVEFDNNLGALWSCYRKSNVNCVFEIIQKIVQDAYLRNSCIKVASSCVNRGLARMTNRSWQQFAFTCTVYDSLLVQAFLILNPSQAFNTTYDSIIAYEIVLLLQLHRDFCHLLFRSVLQQRVLNICYFRAPSLSFTFQSLAQSLMLECACKSICL